MTCNDSGEQMNEQMHGLNNFSPLIVKVSFKKKQHVSGYCSLGGEVVHMDAYAYAHATE